MAADSKDFIPPPALVARVIQIVIEVASCPWKDDLQRDLILSSTPSGNFDLNVLLSLRTKHIEDEFLSHTQQQSGKSTLLLHSMLLRGQYGGMACDIDMIVKYVAVWRARFHGLDDSTLISRKIAERFHVQLPPSFSSYAWVDIPVKMHQKAMENSAQVVNPLVMFGIEALSLKDFALAGIDFHCSSILEDVVLSDQAIVDSIIQIFSNDFASSGNTKDKQWIQVISFMKEVMWKCSAGVNHRFSIADDKSCDGSLNGSTRNERNKLLQEA